MHALLDTKAAAPLIGVAPTTLENWRCSGDGPPFIKMPGLRGAIRYDLADIAVWREQRRFASTAEAAAADT